MEFLLAELNASSDEINSLEKLQTDAMSRRAYLMDSISGCPADTEPVTLRSLFILDPVRESSEYYKVVNQQQEMKRTIETAVNAYKHHMSVYEKTRNEFDAHIDACRRDAAPAQAVTISPVEQSRLSQLSMEVLAAQTFRDASEREYVALMTAYTELLMLAEQIRRRIGPAVVEEVAEYYSKIEHVQAQIRHEATVIEVIRADIERTKNRYKGAMLRLEEVSNGVRQIESNENSEEEK